MLGISLVGGYNGDVIFGYLDGGNGLGISRGYSGNIIAIIMRTKYRYSGDVEPTIYNVGVFENGFHSNIFLLPDSCCIDHVSYDCATGVLEYSLVISQYAF